MLWTNLSIVMLLTVGIRCVPTAHQVRSAIERAKEIDTLTTELNKLDERTVGSSSKSGCPMMANFHGRRTSEDKEQDRNANIMLNAARILLNEGFTLKDLQHEQVRAEFLRQEAGTCPLPTVAACGTEKYRRIDGSCNNIQNPRWGMAGVPQRRVLEPAYEDGIGEARSTSSVINGGALPNPRKISNDVHHGRGPEIRSPSITLHTFQMGQFVDHDLIATPVQGNIANCCNAQNDAQNCLNILIEGRNDPFETIFTEGHCIEFSRSAPVFCPDAFSNGQSRRQQTNGITSFIDASNVYGSSETELAALREPGTGFLKTKDGVRLPDNPDNTVCEANAAGGEACSLAGDHRANTVPSLTAYHYAFVLEHNRIARLLQSSFPDPDTLFQETRKIVIGIMQKIVYDEFLPSFLSPTGLEKYNLLSSSSYQYNPSIDPTISNSFGIAFRMGHTWIPRDMSLFGRNLRPINMRFETDETYNKPFLTYISGNPDGMEGLAYWLSGQNSPETDRIIEEQARSRLFIDRANNVAFDLVALNIQRGRDHGLQPYTAFRSNCGLSTVTDWADLVDHDAETIAMFQTAGYRSPLDIDLFTGALTEIHVASGTVGPTLDCILGEQFMRLKFGDRFWYQGSEVGLSSDQQSAIRSHSLAKIMCDNFNFNQVQYPSAFKATDPRTSCRDIPELNIEVFKPVSTATTTTTTTTTTAAPPATSRRTRPPPNNLPPGGDKNGGRRPGRTFDHALAELLRELEEMNNKD